MLFERKISRAPSDFRRRTPRWLAGLSLTSALSLVCGLAGCGSSVASLKACVPVTTKVFYAQHAAVGAQVSLVPLDESNTAEWPVGFPRGTVADDGTVQFSTFKPGDGAPAGNYAIAIYWPMPHNSNPRGHDRGLEPIDRLYGKFSNLRTQLRTMVPNNQFEIPTIDLARQ